MKKLNNKILWLVVFIAIFRFVTNSQSIVNIEIMPQNPTNQDTVELYSGVFFPFGTPGSCPPLSGFTLKNEDSFLLINLFFDISGVWFQFLCTSVDTTEIGKLATGNYLMGIIVNTIFESDTNFLEDTDTLEFTVINSNDVYDSEVGNSLLIYPNPAKEYLVFEFEAHLALGETKFEEIFQITDIFGRKVAELPLKSEKTVWDCREVKDGIYFYALEIEGKRYAGKVVIRK